MYLLLFSTFHFSFCIGSFPVFVGLFWFQGQIVTNIILSNVLFLVKICLMVREKNLKPRKHHHSEFKTVTFLGRQHGASTRLRPNQPAPQSTGVSSCGHTSNTVSQLRPHHSNQFCTTHIHALVPHQALANLCIVFPDFPYCSMGNYCNSF